MITLMCANCSAAFDARPFTVVKGRRFCSHKCYSDDRSKLTRADRALGIKECARCHIKKPVALFSPASSRDGLGGWCKDCRSLNEKERRASPKLRTIQKTKYETNMVFRAEERLRAICKRCRRQGVEFDLDTDWYATKLAVGSCEVTGLPFDFSVSKRPNPFTPSIDRISAGMGYTKGNCRVVLFAVNTALQDWGLEAFLPIAEALARISRKKEAA